MDIKAERIEEVDRDQLPVRPERTEKFLVISAVFPVIGLHERDLFRGNHGKTGHHRQQDHVRYRKVRQRVEHEREPHHDRHADRIENRDPEVILGHGQEHHAVENEHERVEAAKSREHVIQRDLPDKILMHAERDRKQVSEGDVQHHPAVETRKDVRKPFLEDRVRKIFRNDRVERRDRKQRENKEIQLRAREQPPVVIPDLGIIEEPLRNKDRPDDDDHRRNGHERAVSDTRDLLGPGFSAEETPSTCPESRHVHCSFLLSLS